MTASMNDTQRTISMALRAFRAPALMVAIAAPIAMIAGCGGGDDRPSFTLAWSEYPSWSAFGVASEVGLIDKDAGAYGPIEDKWGVDIVLQLADYDTCMQMYASLSADAVCITNMDILSPSLSRSAVAVLPTSTSKGADALIVTSDIGSIQDLKGKKVHGLEGSVSEYCFVRNLELAGEKESDYNFVMKDPAAASLAMQQKQGGYDAIMVWNPFVLQTLEKRPDAKVLFDSGAIPGEIIDMVVMGKDSLEKEGGEDFACALIDTFYQLNRRIADTATRDDTLVALGRKFSDLGLESMKTVVEQTVFYKTAAEGKALFGGSDVQDVMKKVIDFCVGHDITSAAPKVAYGGKDKGSADTNLRIDPTYIDRVAARP